MSNKFMFKPGTLALFVFIAITGLILYNWTSGSISDITDNTSQNQRESIECAGIDADFVNVDRNGSKVEVLFRINRDLESATVSLRGDTNATVKVENIQTDVMRNVSANVGNLSNIYIKPSSCSQVFSYQ